MEIIDPKLDAYVCAHSENEPKVLADLNRKTHVSVLQPRMLSGHYQGRLLSLLSHMIRPERILEIGTYTGYSAIALAEGLVDGGKLITIDVNEELAEMVEEYIQLSGNGSKIEHWIGDAATLIPSIKDPLDIVFIDADKKNYIRYYELVFDMVKPGGYIIADNVLWSGKVIEDAVKVDRETSLLDAYNKMVHADDRVQEVLLPIRDGLLIARKK